MFCQVVTSTFYVPSKKLFTECRLDNPNSHSVPTWTPPWLPQKPKWSLRLAEIRGRQGGFPKNL